MPSRRRKPQEMVPKLYSSSNSSVARRKIEFCCLGSDASGTDLRYLSEVRLMSALGQKQTFDLPPAMSAIPPKADIFRGSIHVR